MNKKTKPAQWPASILMSAGALKQSSNKESQ